MPRSSFDREELGIQKAVKCKKIYSFQEARRLARGHGFSSKEEFLLYDCPGAYQLPKNPNDIYQEEEKIREASDEDREARIGRLPYRPDIYYQNSWLGWEDYLDITQETN